MVVPPGTVRSDLKMLLLIAYSSYHLCKITPGVEMEIQYRRNAAICWQFYVVLQSVRAILFHNKCRLEKERSLLPF